MKRDKKEIIQKEEKTEKDVIVGIFQKSKNFGFVIPDDKKFGTDIVVISEEGSPKLDSEEILEEIVSLLHCYSMKMYSKRRVAKIKEVLNDESLDK